MSKSATWKTAVSAPGEQASQHVAVGCDVRAGDVVDGDGDREAAGVVGRAALQHGRPLVGTGLDLGRRAVLEQHHVDVPPGHPCPPSSTSVPISVTTAPGGDSAASAAMPPLIR